MRKPCTIRLLPILGVLLLSAVVAGKAEDQSATPAPLDSLRAIHALTNEQAAHLLPVAFTATVTYYRDFERTMFVQDGDVAIYIQPSNPVKAVAGDRIFIQGITQPSFRPFVKATQIRIVGHAPLPKPIAATFDQLIRAQFDCMLVSIHARVRAANLEWNAAGRSVGLQLLADGGTVDVVLDSSDTAPFEGLLDSEVEVTGVGSGRFDGKMQQTGIVLHVSSWAGVKVLQHPAVNPDTLPITPMDQVLNGYHVQVLSQRIRVHGTVTYYQPGTAIVLQDGMRSLWIQTRSIDPVAIGDVADVTGFPALHDGFLTVTNGQIKDSGIRASAIPRPSTYGELVTSHHAFDLVSIEGKVVSTVHEAAQDEYVLSDGSQTFSALFRHLPGNSPENASPMRNVPEGAKVRVTGICMLEDSNPFDVQVPFTILMRSTDDIAVIAPPSWLSIRNLLYFIGFLLLVVFVVGARGWTLERQVRQQTSALAARIEAEAAQEHHQAQIEQCRSHILEAINGSEPLVEVIEEILDLLAFRLSTQWCWCEMGDGSRLGSYPPSTGSLRIVNEHIPAPSGAQLGVIGAAFAAASKPTATEAEALTLAANLATLAIENRRLYSDLLHRSEFDLLTDLHNRFSLDKALAARIEQARLTAGVFGLIYIDLDEFKQVNDLYGHQVGDLYLKEVAARMKRQLRTNDLLARLGGDEFAALVADVPTRAGIQEIAQRLERCLDDPFPVEGYTLRGSASVGVAVYPEDGSTRDSLLSAADAAMYVSKHTRQAESPAARQGKTATPKPGQER